MPNVSTEPEIEGYSDIQVQTVEHQIEIDDDTDLGNTGSFEFGVAFEPTAKQLNNSELAELVYFHRELSAAQVSAAGSDNHESIRWMHGTWINGPTGGGDVDDRIDGWGARSFGDDEPLIGDRATSFLLNSDDQGLLDAFTAVVNGTVNDEPDGLGGGAASMHETREMSYRDLFGRGPVLDANDDLTFTDLIFWNKENGDFTNGDNLSVTYQFYWDIHEIEHARPRYGLI